MKREGKSLVFKIITGIVLMFAVYSVIAAFVGYQGFTDGILKQHADEAYRTADTAALYLDANRMDEYEKSGGKTKEYRSIMKKIDSLCNTQKATFIYVIIPDTNDYAHIKFIFSGKQKDAPYERYRFGYVRETTNAEYRQKYRLLYEKRSDREMLVRDKGFIETDPHITAMIPLRDISGRTKAILCVQRQMDALYTARRRYVSGTAMSVILFSIIAAFVQGTFITRVLLDPIESIIREVGRFSGKNSRPDVKLSEEINNTDEIGTLALEIDNMEEKILKYVDDLAEITAKEERVRTELELASRIQTSFLPRNYLEVSMNGEIDLYADMIPAKEVGGDFYDFFLIDDNHLCMVIADVSGKGIPAALYMMTARTMIWDYAMTGMRPSEILEGMNQRIGEDNPENMFITVWLGIMDITTGVITASNAGHEYPLIIDGKARYLKDPHGFVLGALEEVKYTDYELKLEKGSTLVVYTDGVCEAVSESMEMFGADRLAETAEKLKDRPAEDIVAGIYDAINEFTSGEDQFDDITMICLKLG